MLRTPLFSASVILTVALAIAGNTAIFSVINATMLRPLPFREPGRLVQVAEKNDKLNLPSFGASVLNFIDWREQSRGFEELAAVGAIALTLTGAGEPEQLSGNRISPAMTRVLGITPLAGRDFVSDEERPGAAPVAMVSEGLWKRRFGSDPALVGRTITLNGTPTTVVGVIPNSLNLLSSGEIYVPLTIDRAKENRLSHIILVMGRLKPGVSMQQAQSEMDGVSAEIGRRYPEVRDWGIHLLTLRDTFVSPELKTGLLVLLGSVGFVLLIACANIANLLLARATAREKEIAVRKAVGGSQGQLLLQLLTESMTLSLIGGAAGVVATVLALPLINRVLPQGVLPVGKIEADGSVLGFGLALTLLTGLFFGMAPSWRMASTDVNEVLKQTGRGSASGMGMRLRNALSVLEIALSAVLLIGAGLLIQSLGNLQRVRLGFETHGLLTFQLAPPLAKYPLDTKAPLFYRALLDSLQALPGVRGAAVSSGIPFGNGSFTRHPMLTTGQAAIPPDTKVPIDWRIVSPGYFKAMGIPLVRGRDFSDADTGDGQKVMIVSQATAHKFWGDADPIGRVLRRSANPNLLFTVVGVVGDVRGTALNQDSPTLYYPVASAHVLPTLPLMDVVVRTEGPPKALLSAVRQKVHEMDAELALANVRTMEEWLSNSAAQPRLNALLLGSFASGALVIAAIGIYGVLAYSVNLRTREIGLRMALGANPGNVLRLIISEGLRLALAGVALGLLGGLLVGRALATLVYGVTVRDAATFAGVTLVLTLVALAACVIPAWRAAQVDPMVALRYE